MMLMLKILVLKMLGEKKERKRKCIAIIYYKCKLSLFGRDDTKQAKCFNFIVVPQAEQVSKSTKINKKKSKKLKEMVLEPSFVME